MSSNASSQISAPIAKAKIRALDGYVNATRIDQAGGTAKRLNRYQDTHRCQELVFNIAATVGIPAEDVVCYDAHAPVGQRFTWIHPDLAVPYVAWVAPAFELAVSRHMQAYMRGEVTTEAYEEVAATLFAFLLGHAHKLYPQLCRSNEPFGRQHTITAVPSVKAQLINTKGKGKGSTLPWIVIICNL